MSYGRPVRIDFFSRLVVVLVCGFWPSLVRESDAAGVGTVWEDNGLMRSPFHNAYIPGGNLQHHRDSVGGPASHLIGPGAVVGGGKAQYLQPRIFQGDVGPGVGMRRSGNGRNRGRLNPRGHHSLPIYRQGPPIYWETDSDETDSVNTLGLPRAAVGMGSVLVNEASVFLFAGNPNGVQDPAGKAEVHRSYRVTDTHWSPPAAHRGANEATAALINVNRSYLFNSHQTSGERRFADVSGDGQHAGQGVSPSTWSQNASPFLKLASRQSSTNSQLQLSRKAANADVHTTFYKAMLPDAHHAGSTAHHKAPPKAFRGPSGLKSRQSVVEDENVKQPGSLGKNNYGFVSQKSGFGRRAEVVVAATTMVPLEVEVEREPQKYSIQMGSSSIIAPRAAFRYSEMPTKSMRSANVPLQQGNSKALQRSKLNVPKSEYKAAYRYVQPLNLNTGSKTSLQGHMSGNGKYHVGGLTGLPLRTSTAGQIEGANAPDTNAAGNYILKPPTNRMLPFKARREKAQSLGQGSLQGGSAVNRIGTRTSQAEEMATPSQTQSTPDEERSLKSIPVTDDYFSKRMPGTPNAILVPRSPSRHGDGIILRDYMFPSTSKTLIHLPSQSVPRPLEGEVRNVIGEAVSLFSDTRQSENNPALTRNIVGPNDLEVLSGNTKFPPKHDALAPISATNALSYRGLGKPYSPVFAFAGSYLSRPQLEPMSTPIDTSHAHKAINGNHVYYPRPTRTMVRGRRVKGKWVKKPNRFEKVRFADILGSASFSSAKSTSQSGSGKMANGNKNRARTEPEVESFSFSPWEGNSASYPLISRHVPGLGVREQGGGRVQFSSIRGEFSDYWSGKAPRPGNRPTQTAGSHGKGLPGLGLVAKGPYSNFVAGSSHASVNPAAVADEEWNDLKTSASNASFKSAKSPRSFEATQT